MMTRRRFLMLMGGGAAAGAVALRMGAGSVETTRAGFALGTKVSLTVRHENASAAHRALDAAYAELDLVEDVMSLYRPHSEICALNRDGILRHPHPCLATVLSHAVELSRASGGAFDVTVQPLWSAKATPGTLSLVDWRGIDARPDRIALRPGQQITLNGIAQGFALDRVSAVLRGHGVAEALVDTGEIGAFGRSRAVGIQHPDAADAYVDLARLEGRCMATSGNYATRDHIVEPRTGRIPDHFRGVTIVAKTGLEADGLSTACFVLDLDSALDLVAARGAEALFVTKEGRVKSTEGFPHA
jgi:thiamine biosynthesis lipoprotein